ncbi:MAG: dihydroorotate dehydrogenase-like protein [Acidimicrobiia bacterium]|nr:dihydroorotate dehydrogenase-like protein [Acidimicrobiia bacterium]
MTDLSVNYLGIDLSSPLVASAGPLTGQLDTLRRLADAGAAAVVLPSLFEEEIARVIRDQERVFATSSDSSAEALSYLPEIDVDPGGVDRHLRLVTDAKAAIDVPVIASLNGSSSGGWTWYARALVDAGADALELNVYSIAADIHDDPREVEERYIELVSAVRDAVRVPIAVKVSPFFTAMANVAGRLAAAGADGLVLFNRFYQPDIDLETLDVTPSITLSTSADLRLPLRWIGLLYGRVDASLAASGGVHTPEDVVKVLLAGADVAMTTAALLRHGPEHLTVLRDGLLAWLEARGYTSVAQMRGSVSARAGRDPDAFERANYVEALLRHATHTEPTSWQ